MSPTSAQVVCSRDREQYEVDLDPSSIPRLAAEHGLDLGGESLAGSSAAQWDALYAGTPPWETGRPQPAVAALAQAGRLTGRVLDIGCGTGENALAAAAAGATVTGVDISPRAIEAARAKAAERGLSARFLVADALRLDRLGEQYDVILDSGTFHVFADEDRPRYLASLAAVTRPGGRIHPLCFSDATPGSWGPRRLSRQELTTAFADGWRLDPSNRQTSTCRRATRPARHPPGWRPPAARSERGPRRAGTPENRGPPSPSDEPASATPARNDRRNPGHGARRHGRDRPRRSQPRRGRPADGHGNPLAVSVLPVQERHL